MEVHSENKEGAAPHFRRGFGFHPMVCFLDATGEALAGMLRAGNAAAKSGADQLAVVDAAIAQLPEGHWAGHGPGDDPATVVHQVLVRADTAGAVKGFIDGLVARNCGFSVGARVSDRLDAAIAAVPAEGWAPARNSDGQVRRGAQVAELDVSLDGWPEGTRAICRRERPHPGAQLRLWDHNGLRHQVILTSRPGDPVDVELAHRRHARVENSIRDLKDCGLERMPFSAFAANAAWLQLVLTAADLLAWTRHLCLTGDLARAQPAGRLIRGARTTTLRLLPNTGHAPNQPAARQQMLEQAHHDHPRTSHERSGLKRRPPRCWRPSRRSDGGDSLRMPQLAEQLVEHARMLAELDPTRPKQVHLRRATSAAYYAVFHVASDELSNAFRPAVRPSAARLLKHREAKESAARISNNGLLNVLDPPGACPPDLKRAASDFVMLQGGRHLADYSVASTFSRKQVLDLVDRAERAVNILRESRTSCPDDLQAFLLALLGARKP